MPFSRSALQKIEPHLGVVPLAKKELRAALKKAAHNYGGHARRRFILFGNVKVTNRCGASAFFKLKDCHIEMRPEVSQDRVWVTPFIYWGCYLSDHPYGSSQDFIRMVESHVLRQYHREAKMLFSVVQCDEFPDPECPEMMLPVYRERTNADPPEARGVTWVTCRCGHVYPETLLNCPACGEPTPDE